jgi:hypothetical protein
MANFAKAKTSAPAKTAKGKDEKTRISIQDATFDRIEKLESLQDAMKEIRLKRI